MFIELRDKLAESQRRQANPALSETVTLKITMAPEAAPGQRELRLATQAGLSNPVVFQVGQLPEISKQPAGTISISEPGAVRAVVERTQRTPAQQEPPVEITLPAIVNGQMMAGGVDRYRFAATKGQQLVIAASAQELIPYIADAVPGWFQAALTLHDANGMEVASADHYLFHPDPVLYYEVPKDGQYVLDIHDSIFRGRDDFVYRVTLGALPFVTGIFPLGGKAGERTTVELQGWNLPVTRLTQRSKGKAKDIEQISVRSGGWTSNSLAFARDTLRECREKEPNNAQQSAQRLKLPIVVNGRIERPGDWDVFRFEGRPGEEIVAEVYARRLGSPLDSVLRLTDAGGRELASNDDFEDKGAALTTHQADSRIAFKLPAKGTYYLWLGDTQGQGGTAYGYRLRVSHPQPDFALRIVPSSITARSGVAVPVTVYALRNDGFAGEIALTLKDAPGFSLAGAVIPANHDKVRLTLTAPQGASEKPRSLSVEGYATIQGHEERRRAVPADDMMQAFAYHHLVPAQELLVWVTGPNRPPLHWKPTEKTLLLPAGGTAQLRLPLQINAPRQLAGAQVQLTLSEPPEGVSLQEATRRGDGMSVLLRAEAGKALVGTKGNLILEAFVEREMDAGAGGGRRRQSLGILPAIPYEVVGR
jgi:hypothetical protein